MSLLAPSAAWWLLLVPLLVALYVFRPQPRRKLVPSLRLWERLPQVERPKARLRRPPLSLLLLLQAALLLMGAFALTRPALTAPAGGQLLLLVDASGSMLTTESGTTRFERARREARHLVDAMASNGQGTLVRVGPSVTTACAACGKSTLLAAIDALRPGAGVAAWPAALDLATGLARRAGEGSAQAVVISDGAFDVLPAGDLPFAVRYLGVGGPAANVAVDALSARRPPDGSLGFTAYGRVQNWGRAEGRVRVSVLADTVPLDSRDLALPPGGHADLVWQLAAGTRKLSVTLTPGDALPTDDHAVLFLPAEGQRKVVIVSPDPDLLTRAVSGLPGLAPIAPTDPAAPDAAFTIIEGKLPDPLPSGGLLLFDPDGSLAGSRGQMTFARPVAAETAHPLLRGIDVSALSVDAARVLDLQPWMQPLVTAAKGPLVVAGERDGRRIVILPFNLRDSNLPTLLAFPLLMSNAAEWLYPPAGALSVRPGEALRLAPGVTVQTPGGAAVTVPPSGVFAATEDVGVYKIMKRAPGGGELESFAVNMAGENESDIAPRPHPELDRTAAPAPGDRLDVQDLWPPLAMSALFLVGLEWLVYCLRRGRA